MNIINPPNTLRPLLLAAAITGALTLSGCGGSSSSSSSSNSTTNNAPLANAGADQTVSAGSLVNLDGSASNDVDGDTLSYIWRLTGKPASSNSALNNANNVKPSFTVDVAGTYTIDVTVSDGTDTAADQVVVTATGTANTAPEANAGADKSVSTGSSVALDASASSDADHDTLNYTWALVSRPTGSAAVLSSSSVVNPTFTADVAGTYTFDVTVSDGTDSATDRVVVTATGTVNTAPVANAGVDKSVSTGSAVTLDASASSDADNDTLNYTWAIVTLPSGSTVALSSSSVANPTFTPDIAGTYTFQVSVSDGTVAVTDQVTVTASAATTTGSTDGVLCDYNDSTVNNSTSVNATSTATWSCEDGLRSLVANGLPDHDVGTFPNTNNPNTISAQTVADSFTLMPNKTDTATALGGPAGVTGYVLNGVKIDANTAGSCDDSGMSCSLIGNTGNWSIEALFPEELGEAKFDFGTDDNNAHVQPGGVYHYHGMPEGFIAKQGGNDSTMTIIGWAADGFPIYARYGYSVAGDATSALKNMTGSYQLVSDVSSSRPSTDTYALGTFKQDWEYVAGSGDLDECNGRVGVTPEFPDGIYHYFATDSYPYFQRCVTGEVETAGGDGGPPPPQ